MNDPRLDNISAWQPADDKRPFDEWLLEQSDLGDAITGGEKTIDEYFSERRRKRAQATDRHAASAETA